MHSVQHEHLGFQCDLLVLRPPFPFLSKWEGTKSLSGLRLEKDFVCLGLDDEETSIAPNLVWHSYQIYIGSGASSLETGPAAAALHPLQLLHFWISLPTPPLHFSFTPQLAVRALLVDQGNWRFHDHWVQGSLCVRRNIRALLRSLDPQLRCPKLLQVPQPWTVGSPKIPLFHCLMGNHSHIKNGENESTFTIWKWSFRRDLLRVFWIS